MARPFTDVASRSLQSVVKEVISVSENRLRWLYYGDHLRRCRPTLFELPVAIYDYSFWNWTPTWIKTYERLKVTDKVAGKLKKRESEQNSENT